MNTGSRILWISRWNVMFGLGFAILGMALGIYMALSKNHGQHVTHAHVLLLGFVVSVLYGAIYRLWLASASVRLATIQTVLHQLGSVLIVIGLFLLFSGAANEDSLGPLLGPGSIAAISSAVLMFYQMVRAGQQQQSTPIADRLVPASRELQG